MTLKNFNSEHNLNNNDFNQNDDFFLKQNFIPVDEEIKTVCASFENLISNGSSPDIELFLKQTKSTTRTRLLSRLILIEVRHRIMRGDTPSIDEYIKRFPQEADTISSLKSYFDHISKEMASASAVTIKAVNELFKKLSRFELRSEIGSGAFGSVWLAWDVQLKRYVAVKTFEKNSLQDDQLDPVLHEAVCTAQLRHANIISLYDYGSEGDIGYLVMEYLPSGDLKKLINNKPLDVNKSAELCMKIARALHHAHNADEQVIHRDIKPSNILLDLNGEPKIGDFGIARSSAMKTISKESKILGTPAYMSPEQIRNTGVGPWSDVYSLGIVFYEMLTGKPPFEGEIRELIVSVQYREIPSLRSVNKNIPKDIDTIFNKATAKLKKDRYQTAEEFAKDLELFLSGKEINAKPVHPIVKFWRKNKKHSITVISILVALITLGYTYFLLSALSLPDPDKVRMSIKVEPEGSELEVYPLEPETGKAILRECKYFRYARDIKVDLIPGDYLLVSKYNMGKPGEMFNYSYRRAPEINTVNVPIAFRPLYYKKLGKQQFGWMSIENNATVSMKGFTLVDLKPFEHTDEVQSFYKKHDRLNDYKFYIYNDILRREDIIEIKQNKEQYENMPAEQISEYCNEIYFRALVLAEIASCRLPYLLEYEMLELFVNLKRKYNNEEVRVYGLNDNKYEWTNDKVPTSITNKEEKIHTITGQAYGYYYVYDKTEENYQYNNDLSKRNYIRLVKDFKPTMKLK